MASEYGYVNQEKSTPKWAWLLVVLVALFFVYWAIDSCYAESVECRGQGCLIVWVETLFIYGLAYLLLLPAYLWMAAGRPGWVGILAAGGVVLSLGLLYFHTSHFTESSASWSNIGGWPHSEDAASAFRLLLCIGVTSLLLVLTTTVRRLLRR
jgi:energy-coupling factor transporter transmembrane protein EcfT